MPCSTRLGDLSIVKINLVNFHDESIVFYCWIHTEMECFKKSALEINIICYF